MLRLVWCGERRRAQPAHLCLKAKMEPGGGAGGGPGGRMPPPPLGFPWMVTFAAKSKLRVGLIGAWAMAASVTKRETIVAREGNAVKSKV